MKQITAVVALCLATICPSAAHANDSSAAIGLGGLELTQNDAISMDSEELFISKTRVTVKYQFTNTSDKDVQTLVSFPLPAIPDDIDGYLGDQSFPDWKELEFKTLVDGKPAQLAMREEVTLVGRPGAKGIEARLKDLGWPVDYWSDYEFEQKLEKLPAAQRDAYLAEGLLRKSPDGEYLFPNWQVNTHVTRMQTFPAGKAVTVEHSYQPVAGGSVGGGLELQWRGGKDGSLARYKNRYCTDKVFLSSFDRRNAEQNKLWIKKTGEHGINYYETWLSYVLKSGANWKGPIKDFRLVVDKGAAGNLLSMCMSGVKKISRTQFEVRKKNFEPTQDLNILIVEFTEPQQY